MSIKSMYADRRQEIQGMHASGMTYKAMVNRLQSEGIPAKIYSLWSCCQRMDKPTVLPVPHCTDCEQRMVVDSAERTGGHIYICLAAKKEIRGSCQTSPQWCGKRGKDENRVT